MEMMEQVNQVLSYSQDIDYELINTTNILKTWEENKAALIKAFGGKSIFEYGKVRANLSPEEKKDRFISFRRHIVSEYQNTDLANFLKFNENSFFDNKVKETYRTSTKIIPKGSKIVKSFKYFVKDPKELADLQTQASMIIQEDKIEGTLCFSVHPLDFLSLSENNYKWRSCHSLRGDYRSGNLSYLLDKTSFICYLKSENDEVLPNFPATVPWNSKKWRMLMFTDECNNIFFAGRQYPFFSQNLLDMVRDIILDVLKFNFDRNGEKFSQWSNENIENFNGINLDQNHILISRTIYPIHTIIKNADKSCHYNDLLYSSCYTPRYMWKKYKYYGDCAVWERDQTPKIEIGERTPCIVCGKYPTADSDTFLCDACLSEYGDNSMCNCICSCCGEYFEEEQGIFDDYSENFYCHDCLSKYYSVCSECGRIELTDDLIVTENGDAILCNSCYTETRGYY